jgi:hypothetical protein
MYIVYNVGTSFCWVHYSPNRDVTGSSPDEIIEFFQFNRNEYQKMFLGVKRCRRGRLTTSTPSVSRLCRQYGILNISQTYRPPRPATGIALLFLLVCGSTVSPFRMV